jgi:hypothetical protein
MRVIGTLANSVSESSERMWAGNHALKADFYEKNIYLYSHYTKNH